MIKKKAKAKTVVAKKTSKKKSSPKKVKPLHPAEVRKSIAAMVESEAKEMAKAVIHAGKTGQLAQVKYLFEVAEIFPTPTDGSQATEEEESLAKTLLRRLDLPDEPIVRDENGEIVTVKPVQKMTDASASSEPADVAKKSEESVKSGEPVVV